jgi:hypothetical protein
MKIHLLLLRYDQIRGRIVDLFVASGCVLTAERIGRVRASRPVAVLIPAQLLCHR